MYICCFGCWLSWFFVVVVAVLVDGINVLLALLPILAQYETCQPLSPNWSHKQSKRNAWSNCHDLTNCTKVHAMTYHVWRPRHTTPQQFKTDPSRHTATIRSVVILPYTRRYKNPMYEAFQNKCYAGCDQVVQEAGYTLWKTRYIFEKVPCNCNGRCRLGCMPDKMLKCNS